MSQPYVGEIRMVGFNFQVNGWEYCNGQLLSIAENDVLFNLIGTTYGGDGQTTFGLPNLQGRLVVHQGPGFVVGQQGGSETVTLTSSQLPVHSHAPQANSHPGTSSDPTGAVWAAPPGPVRAYTPAAANVAMKPSTVLAAGGVPVLNQVGNVALPHENLAPYVTINFIISLFGVYPSQN